MLAQDIGKNFCKPLALVLLLAIPEDSAAQSMTITGVIETFELVQETRSDTLTINFDSDGNEILRSDQFRETLTTTTQQGTERCVRDQRSFRFGTGEPTNTTDITTCGSASTSRLRVDSFFERAQTDAILVEVLTFGPGGIIDSYVESEQTSTHSAAATLQATIAFPDLPVGATVTQVRITPQFPGAGLTRPTDWVFPGSTLIEVGPPEIDPVFLVNCAEGFVSQNLVWEFPGSVVNEAGLMDISFLTSADCTFSSSSVIIGSRRTTVTYNGVSGSMHGVFRIEADVEMPQAIAVKFGAFIPFDSVVTPFGCVDPTNPGGPAQALRHAGDTRVSFSADFNASARATTTIEVVADASVTEADGSSVNSAGEVDGTLKKRIGDTKSYAPPAYDDFVIDSNDDDRDENGELRLNDCFSLHQIGSEDPETIVTSVTRSGSESVVVRMQGEADNPLAPIACSIDWDLEFGLNINGDWTLTGRHDQFPSMEIFANDTRILGSNASGPVMGFIPAVLRLCNHIGRTTVNLSGTLP